jgi:hypothetical protein
VDGKQFGVGIEATVLDGMGACGGAMLEVGAIMTIEDGKTIGGTEVSITGLSVLVGGSTYTGAAEGVETVVGAIGSELVVELGLSGRSPVIVIVVDIVLCTVLVEVLLFCPTVDVEVSVVNIGVAVFVIVTVMLCTSVTICVVASIHVCTTYGYSTTV